MKLSLEDIEKLPIIKESIAANDLDVIKTKDGSPVIDAIGTLIKQIFISDIKQKQKIIDFLKEDDIVQKNYPDFNSYVFNLDKDIVIMIGVFEGKVMPSLLAIYLNILIGNKPVEIIINSLRNYLFYEEIIHEVLNLTDDILKESIDVDDVGSENVEYIFDYDTYQYDVLIAEPKLKKHLFDLICKDYITVPEDRKELENQLQYDWFLERTGRNEHYAGGWYLIVMTSLSQNTVKRIDGWDIPSSIVNEFFDSENLEHPEKIKWPEDVLSEAIEADDLDSGDNWNFKVLSNRMFGNLIVITDKRIQERLAKAVTKDRRLKQEIIDAFLYDGQEWVINEEFGLLKLGIPCELDGHHFTEDLRIHVKDCVEALEISADSLMDIFGEELAEIETIKEDINPDDVEESPASDIYSELENIMGTEDVNTWNTYITPNGLFLNPSRMENYDEYEDWGGDDFEIIWDVAADFGINENILMEHCMKFNGTWPYLVLPDEDITSEQKDCIRELCKNWEYMEYDKTGIQEWVDDEVRNGRAEKTNVSDFKWPMLVVSKDSHVKVFEMNDNPGNVSDKIIKWIDDGCPIIRGNE